MSETKKFYTIGDCVRVRRTDDTGSEHDEFVADVRNWQHAQAIADAMNREVPNEHSRSIEITAR